MMKQDTDWACGIDAVSTRRPLSSVCRSNVGTSVDGIDSLVAHGEKTRHAIAAQPEWLAAVPTDRRLPPGRILYTGCGTSFHAAQSDDPRWAKAREAYA
jgi:fructoselysine-6-P-deglycase FrlB-like protein